MSSAPVLTAAQAIRRYESVRGHLTPTRELVGATRIQRLVAAFRAWNRHHSRRNELHREECAAAVVFATIILLVAL